MSQIQTIPVTPSQTAQMQNNIGAMDKIPQEKLYQPGKYTIPPELLEPIPRYEKKSGGFFSFLGKLVFTTILLGAAVGLLRKYPLAKMDLDAQQKGLFNNLKQYTAKAGDFVNKKIVGNIINFFKSLKKEKPKNVENKK